MRYSSLEEHQSGKRVNAVLLRLIQIANFHKGYIVLVAIVVDILQFAQHLLALLLILVIYRMASGYVSVNYD